MNIKEQLKKIKPCLAKIVCGFKGAENELFLVFTVVFVALIAFGLGRLSVVLNQKMPAVIQNAVNFDVSATETTGDVSENINVQEGSYLASKNGTKYYLPWCASADRIKEENKIWFKSREEAERSGYSPAANCKGL